MLEYEDALSAVLRAARPLGVERVRLEDSLGRFLAEDVAADADIPPFDRSTVDGYACRRSDLRRELRVVAAVHAGEVPRRRIGRGECARIMTGAAVPPGADCVVMLEEAVASSGGRETVRVAPGAATLNILRRGSDLRRGQRALRTGEPIRAAELAVLASVGCTRPLVGRKARVGVISTGDELIAPGSRPGTHSTRVRDSNAVQLVAQAARAGALARHHGIAPDDPAAIRRAVRRALRTSDLVVLSGGVSVGERDLVPEVLRSCGFRILFDRVAMKPGKPVTFAVSDKALCLGLPGNPVSSFTAFEVLARPLLRRMMGCRRAEEALRMPLAKAVGRNRLLALWVPVRIVRGRAEPVEYHGSAHSLALAAADGLAAVPAGPGALRKGAVVSVRPF